MKTALLFFFGLLTGACITIGLQSMQGPDSSSSAPITPPGPVGGGYYRGPIPDFTVKSVSGNVYEHTDSNWVFISMDNKEVPFQSFKGKVLFLNLWATWCGPCIEEMPEIAQLQAMLNPDEYAVVLVSDEQERLVQAFNNEHQLPLYVSRGSIPVIFKGKGLPSTFIIDKAGLIRYKHAGPSEWSHPSVVNFLSSLSRENV